MHNLNELYKECRLCARCCGVNRTEDRAGYCGSGADAVVARAALHMWEEPPISGDRGSGTVFFSGCSLGCIFCQNHEISVSQKGKAVSCDRLSEIMLNLQSQGAHNINFVTPTHYAPSIIRATSLARARGLCVPIVYNTGSYEMPETVELLSETVDIYLADFKFYTKKTASYANAPDYPEVAKRAIDKMVAQRPAPIIENGIMKRGVIVRILLLPGAVAEAKLAVGYLLDKYGDSIYVSLMNQYTPMPKMQGALARRVTREEYDELVDYAVRRGLKNGFIQDGDTAKESFIPAFDGSGV